MENIAQMMLLITRGMMKEIAIPLTRSSWKCFRRRKSWIPVRKIHGDSMIMSHKTLTEATRIN
jgi:hypothetical protein